MQDFYVYILKCRDDSFYVGHTDNLDQRISNHSIGQGCSFTARRLPIKLVFVQEVESRDQAFVLERQIKNWSRAKKEALIAGDWNRLKILAKKKFG